MSRFCNIRIVEVKGVHHVWLGFRYRRPFANPDNAVAYAVELIGGMLR